MNFLSSLLRLPVALASCLLCTSWALPDAAGSCADDGCGGGDGQGIVTLMQHRLNVQRRGQTNVGVQPALTLWGRTYLSIDPSASAKFFVDYFNATVVPLESCDEVERTAVNFEVDPGRHATVVFIKDESLPLHELWHPGRVVPRVESLEKAAVAGTTFSPWLDNHDGYNNTYFNLEKAMADGVDLMLSKISADYAIVRVNVPGTMYTVEVSLPPEVIMDHGALDYFAYDAKGYDCRDSIFVSTLPVGWWKATFAVANPVAAANFTIDVLGAETMPAPYPSPSHVPLGCTSASWTLLVEPRFQFHFVNSVTATGFEDSVFKFNAQVESVRDLGSGSFDVYMHNSVIFSVKSLDPYIGRLRAHGLPFLLTDVGAGQRALFVDIPGAAITIQFRSSSVSAAQPKHLEVCSQSFGNV